jgi:hypothetical protein
VEFPLEQGGTIVVEVAEPSATADVERAARPGEIAERATESFGAALEARYRFGTDCCVLCLQILPDGDDGDAEGAHGRIDT